MNRRAFLASGISLVALSRFGKAFEIQTPAAEAATVIGGALKIADRDSSAGYLVSLTQPGHGIKFTDLLAGNKLAIRYASMSVGTISVAVNDEQARKVNVHSSGALTSSYLHTIVGLAIPAKATVTISLATDDVGVNIDRIIVGDGNLGLPPDIWNLPPLPVAAGPYSPIGKPSAAPIALQRGGAMPSLAHGRTGTRNPCRSRAIGMRAACIWKAGRNTNIHLKHFGHPSEYGYKDICHNWVIDRWNPDELMELYVEMGARYFMAMGCHHDNFDCFDSRYQPWNSVRVGPKVDIVGTWEKVARRTECASASVFMTPRRVPGASLCRCVTPATRAGR